MGSFRLAAGRLHLHKHFNFAESQEETVWPSLRHSCRSELTRQGISLPQDRYCYGRRLPGLRSRACTPSLNLPAPGRRHTLYVHFRVCRVLCFQQTVAATDSLRPRRPSDVLLQANGAYLLPKLRYQFAEFLLLSSLKRLSIFYLPTCVGLRYGLVQLKLRGFSWNHFQSLREPKFARATPLSYAPGFTQAPSSMQQQGLPTP
eukprot:TRINITY_DN139_c0_g1_i1.p1 TRINITY_DN139_c0_g1~~TRINITY_DN139_c0_g1_i1.p1  ORF type:complete len:203 (-),score=-49.90 TRINITY_DN139_c0_g1_i1:1301-1909(-)